MGIVGKGGSLAESSVVRFLNKCNLLNLMYLSGFSLCGELASSGSVASTRLSLEGCALLPFIVGVLDETWCNSSFKQGRSGGGVI